MFSLVLLRGLWPRWYRVPPPRGVVLSATPGWGCASPLVLRAPDGRQLWTSRDAGLRGAPCFPIPVVLFFSFFFHHVSVCYHTETAPYCKKWSLHDHRRFVKNSMPQCRANNFSCSSYSSSWGLWPLWYRVPPPRGVVLSATPEWGVALPWFGVVVSRPGVGRKRPRVLQAGAPW